MDEIKGIARAKFFPGQLAEWKRLTEEATAAANRNCSPPGGRWRITIPRRTRCRRNPPIDAAGPAF